MPAVLTRSVFDLGAQASSYKSLTVSVDVPGGFTAFVNGTPMLSENSPAAERSVRAVHQ